MKFRTVLAATMLALLAGVVSTTVFAVVTVVRSAAETTLGENLERSQRVFSDLGEYRGTLFESQGRVVAEEPRLKAVVATQDISPETVLGVARELKRAVQSDLFIITDRRGNVVADADNPKAYGAPLRKNAVVSKAFDEGEAFGVWVDSTDGKVQEVYVRRLQFGTEIVGTLIMGFAIDDRVMKTIYQQTGSSVAIFADDKLITNSDLYGDAEATADSLNPAAAIKVGEAPKEVDIDGTTYLGKAIAYPSYTGKLNLRYVLLGSLDAALEPGRRLIRAVVVISGLALLAALVGAGFLARRLSKPLDQLVDFTKAIGSGDLKKKVYVHGSTEIVSLGESMNKMVGELDHSREQLGLAERVKKEMEIAQRLQTAILPRDFSEVLTLEISAAMVAADEVGGDYYDVLPVHDGCWIGIGDVAGHGLNAGLVMLMVRSVVAALVRDNPDAEPKDIVSTVNEVIYDSVRNRLERDEHVTFCLMRYYNDGRIVYAGAHEPILLSNAKGKMRWLNTPGTWIGAVKDIRAVTVNVEHQLNPNDLIVLYSDGILEAMNEEYEQFDMPRLEDTLRPIRDEPVDKIRDTIMTEVEKFMHIQDDDLTLLVIRYLGN